MLDTKAARKRQKRLLQVMQDLRLDAAVIGLSKHVYYLTAHLPFWQNFAGLVLFADGRSVLVTANKPDEHAAADSVRTYEATWSGTQRQEQPFVLADALIEIFNGHVPGRIGIDTSPVGAAVAVEVEAKCVLMDAEIWQMRRRKDPDELALMKVAIDCTRAMYDRARQIIEPGIPEMRVYEELHTAAVQSAQEPLSDHLGNDFACGVIGGPPRKDHRAEAGQLYILDLGPAYRGYFSDNCRTFSVNRRPADEQLKAWQTVTAVFPIVEQMARPGVRCRDIYQAIDDHYRHAIGKPFPHHLGHGVGLQPHEFPHLNPKWDDTLLEGEVFTCEPGLYSQELAGGMRIENQYLVRAEEVENLTPFPMELA